MPLANPYTFRVPMDDPNYGQIHEKFLQARNADLNVENPLVSPAFFNISTPILPVSPAGNDPALPHTGCVVKLVKVGILNRKDDIVEGGKRAYARKWKGWGAIVTNSQLLFYRDAAHAMNIQQQFMESTDLPPLRIVLARPDELWSLKNTLAVSDKSYTKVLPSSTHVIISAER